MKTIVRERLQDDPVAEEDHEPCADCGKPVAYTDARGWFHVNPDDSCWLHA